MRLRVAAPSETQNGPQPEEPPPMEQSPLAIYQAHLDKGELPISGARRRPRGVLSRLSAPIRLDGARMAGRLGAGNVYATTVTHSGAGEPYNVALIDCDEGFRL